MRTFFRVIGGAVLGAALAWAAVFAACALYDRVVPKPSGDDSRPWMQFALLMFSPWVGVGLGASFGIARARASRKPSPPPDGPAAR
jgi:hypothetical protein